MKRLVGKLDITPLLSSKELSSQEDLLNLENEKYVVSPLLSGKGPVSSLDCPASDILEFLSIGNELQMISLGWESPSTACFKDNVTFIPLQKFTQRIIMNRSHK